MTTDTTGTGREVLRRALAAVRERTDRETTIRAVTAGPRQLLVDADVGGERTAGVAHRPEGQVPAVEPGADAVDVAGWAVDAGAESTVRAVGMATLNALSAPLIDWQVGDPMAALSADVSTIATVGLFRPAFRKFDAVDVRVIERDFVGEVEAPPGVIVSTFAPEQAAEAIDGVNVLFVTGSSLVYGGLGRYLDAARDVPTVVLIGATASFFPAPAFAAGVTMLAGARVTDIAAVRAGIEAGDCGTDLHDLGLEKVYVTAGDRPAGLDMNGLASGSN